MNERVKVMSKRLSKVKWIIEEFAHFCRFFDFWKFHTHFYFKLEPFFFRQTLFVCATSNVEWECWDFYYAYVVQFLSFIYLSPANHQNPPLRIQTHDDDYDDGSHAGSSLRSVIDSNIRCPFFHAFCIRSRASFLRKRRERVKRRKKNNKKGTHSFPFFSCTHFHPSKPHYLRANSHITWAEENIFCFSLFFR